ncbi:MAG: M23 family metallopeptidase [Pyrinomonadaceae bacterium]|nr:M23 family metallopeptidase [Pyrinomonadaceae bacterium]
MAHRLLVSLLMRAAGRIAIKVIFAVYIIALHFVAAAYLIEKYFWTYVQTDNSFIGDVADPYTPEPIPIPVLDPPVVPRETPQIEIPTEKPSDLLVIPVAGVKRGELIDSYSDVRGEERSHDAIDIAAPRGTPVLAAADGELVRFHDSVPGGVTIYQVSVDKRYVYYYAHLERRAETVAEKAFVKRGTVIGYVGDTGNAGTGNYHLHFSIGLLTDPDRYWESTNINPFALLINGIETQ